MKKSVRWPWVVKDPQSMGKSVWGTHCLPGREEPPQLQWKDPGSCTAVVSSRQGISSQEGQGQGLGDWEDSPGQGQMCDSGGRFTLPLIWFLFESLSVLCPTPGGLGFPSSFRGLKTLVFAMCTWSARGFVFRVVSFFENGFALSQEYLGSPEEWLGPCMSSVLFSPG